MAISSGTMQELLILLRPFMQDERERRAYVSRALGSETPVLCTLVWNTAVNVFIPELVRKLDNFGEISPGKPALCALLEVIREDVGADVQNTIDKLLQQIEEELKTQHPSQTTYSYLYTLDKHSSSVETVAISPSGKILASGSSDTTIKLWNLSNCEVLHDIKGNSLVVKHVVFSPSGQTLASCGNFEAAHGNIKLWDVNTGKLKATLGQGFSNFGIFSLAFCPDGSTIAVGHYGAVKLWDLRTSSERDIWIGHGIQVNSLVFSSCGQYLVLGCSNGDIKIWDWRRQNLLRTINQNSNIVDFMTSFVLKVLWCVAISPEGKVIASCGQNLPLALWNFDSGTVLHTFPSTATIRCVAFSPDGNLLASGGEDREVRIWNARTYEILFSFEHEKAVNCLAFSPDAKTLVSGGDDKKIQVWRLYS